jgi:hypothetical protein
MYSNNKSGKASKASKGSVQIKSSNDRLQLVLNFGGKRHYLSPAIPTIPSIESWRRCAPLRSRRISSMSGLI